MTIQVTITNSDTSGRAVMVHEVDIDKSSGARKVSSKVRLAKGQTRSFYIHLLRDLNVSEDDPD
jgi:hypothetical protein